MIEIMDQLVERFLEAGKKPGSIMLYPHVGIDADALGSSLALLICLRKINVQARLLLDEPIPDKLKFLPGLDLIETFNEDDLDKLALDQQIALTIDCSEGGRVGRRQALYERAGEFAVIDHHVSGGESGHLRWIDHQAAASGEMVYDLIHHLQQKLGCELLDEDTETLLMTAIVSDTGGFVYSNTSARTFRTAANLMDREIDLRRITYQLFDRTSQVRLRLMGRIFTDARFSTDGRLVMSAVNRELLQEYGATDTDVEGVIAHLRNVAGVEVAFLIREVGEDTLRVNIRSSDSFNAALFASQFGGGGHPKAAGMQLRHMTIEQAEDMILTKAGERL